jgi:hypothetical protein
MDSLKFHPGPPCLTLLNPAGGPVSRVARPQGRHPAVVFYLFGHPTPYAYGLIVDIRRQIIVTNGKSDTDPLVTNANGTSTVINQVRARIVGLVFLVLKTLAFTPLLGLFLFSYEPILLV